MSIQEIRPYIEQWRRDGVAAAVAVLTTAWSSAPRRPGARFVRSATERIGGNISAGCVEADLALRLDRVLESGTGELVSYGVSDETAAGVGLSCGGRIELFLEPYEASSPVWSELHTRLDGREPAMLVTALDTAAPRHWLLDTSGEEVATDAADSVPPAAREAGLSLLGAGGAQVLTSREGTDLFVEVFLPARRLVIVGATPVGASLARLASMADIPVCVIEPREGYRRSLDGAGVEVLSAWPDEAFGSIHPDASCAVAVVAHDERLDVPALAGALKAGCAYVGLLGGRRTREDRFERLRRITDEDLLADIRAPIGLEIGAERPEEIAVSILAEVIAAWRGA